MVANLCRVAPASATTRPPERDLSSAVRVLTLNPCLEQTALVDEIEHWLGRSRVDARLSIDVRESNEAVSFSVRMATKEPLTRAFSHLPPDCEEQRAAIALSVALAIDAVAPRSRLARTTPILVTVDGAVTTSLPSRVGLGGSADLYVPLRDWFVPRVGFFAAQTAEQSLSAELPARFDTRLLAGNLDGCVATWPTPWLFAVGCMGFRLGALSTSGSGLAENRTNAALWSALGAALELHARFTPVLGLHLAVDALVPFRDTDAQILDTQKQIVVSKQVGGTMGVVRFGATFFF